MLIICGSAVCNSIAVNLFLLQIKAAVRWNMPLYEKFTLPLRAIECLGFPDFLTVGGYTEDVCILLTHNEILVSGS